MKSEIIRICVACAVIGFAGGFASGFGFKTLLVDAADKKEAIARANRAEAVTRQDQTSAAITQSAGEDARKSQADIVATSKIIKERISDHAPDLSDRTNLPSVFVGLHDAAATGDLSYLPDATTRSDDPAGTVDALVVSEVVTANYATCLASADRHNRLIDWVEAQQRLAQEGVR